MIAISIDGAIVAPEAATISVLDRGLLYGDGLFEVLRTWHGALVTLDEHLDRLEASARALALRLPARGELAAWIRATAGAARERGGAAPGELRVRVVVTRGPGTLAARLAELGSGRTIVIAEPLPPQPRELALATVDLPLPRRRSPAHKTLAYLDHVLARELAAAAGADEALRLDEHGNAVECATSNLFVVRAGAVATPPAEGVLPGITRARVLALCAQLGIAATVRPVTAHEVRGADELFVTSALRGVVAITRLDGEARAAGALTARIADAYAHEMRGLV